MYSKYILNPSKFNVSIKNIKQRQKCNLFTQGTLESFYNTFPKKINSSLAYTIINLFSDFMISTYFKTIIKKMFFAVRIIKKKRKPNATNHFS